MEFEPNTLRKGLFELSLAFFELQTWRSKPNSLTQYL